jgi:histidine decarboxylase
VQLRQQTRGFFERLVLWSRFPAIGKVFLIDWALMLDRGVWFGALWQLPKFWSVWAAFVGQKNQLNQLGNPAFVSKNERNFVQELELQVIEYLKKQLHAPSQISGYCTTGGTEANMFLLWLARSFFEKKSIQNMIVFGTALTHYSVTKAARILRVPFVAVAVSDNYTLSPVNLTRQFEVEYGRGVRGFAVVVTWGYSSTGGCDDWQKIEPVIRAFHQAYPDCQFFVWIDAAAQGLPLLYLSNSHTNPFKSPYVQGYVVDYHKFGGAPVGSGVVLYRKPLINLINTSISYLKETDATLLGSRSGSAVLAIWSSQQVYSKIYWQHQFQRQLEMKQQWLQKMKLKHPKLSAVTHSKTLSLGLRITDGFKRLSSETELEYALLPIAIELMQQDHDGLKKQVLRHYKLHFTDQTLPVL